MYTKEIDGFTVTATIHVDDSCDTPWDYEEGHGPVSNWTTRAKRPGERVLNRDGRSYRYYGFQEAVKIAKRDGWGPNGPADAAERDFQRLKDWCDDVWCYVGVAVTVSKAGVRLTGDYDHALWRIESDAGEYLTEVAEELTEEALEAARAKLAELAA